MKIAVTAATGHLGAEVVKATTKLIGRESVVAIARRNFGVYKSSARQTITRVLPQSPASANSCGIFARISSPATKIPRNSTDLLMPAPDILSLAVK